MSADDERFGRKVLEQAEPFFTVRCVPRFQDVDGANIVFFARILTYLHDAYVAYLASGGIVLAQLLATREWGTPLLASHAEFLAPVRFGEEYDVGVVKITLQRSKFTMGYRLARVPDGRVSAVGWMRHIVIDERVRAPIDPPKVLVDLFRSSGPAFIVDDP
jgi:4-hydroxybenzoyl-CoA thioesterase